MAADITNQQLLDAMTAQLGVITDNMVTKDDLKEELKSFATKEDLKSFVTKDDLKSELQNFATKDDLKQELQNFPTKDDLKQELEGFATKSNLTDTVNTAVIRLQRTIAEGRAINVHHHLETRKAIGDLTREHTALREGIARAVEAK